MPIVVTCGNFCAWKFGSNSGSL